MILYNGERRVLERRNTIAFGSTTSGSQMSCLLDDCPTICEPLILLRLLCNHINHFMLPIAWPSNASFHYSILTTH